MLIAEIVLGLSKSHLGGLETVAASASPLVVRLIVALEAAIGVGKMEGAVVSGLKDTLVAAGARDALKDMLTMRIGALEVSREAQHARAGGHGQAGRCQNGCAAHYGLPPPQSQVSLKSPSRARSYSDVALPSIAAAITHSGLG